MSVDFWVESASPVKNPLREAFLEYSKEIYEKKGLFISSYFPAVMGGDMPAEDYLINMEVCHAPDNYLSMGFGECSSKAFYEKYINSGVYKSCEIVAWFPETMVVDTKRLGSRPLPKTYSDLINSCYKNEICIIGTKAIPDPLTALFILKEKGEAAARSFVNNIAGFGAPVNVIRHIGKSSNSFASIFIMPLLFANVCSELTNTLIIKPEDGYYSEPFLLFSKKNNPAKEAYVKDFISSDYFCRVFEEKLFFPEAGENSSLINSICRQKFFPELTKVYPMLREHMEK